MKRKSGQKKSARNRPPNKKKRAAARAKRSHLDPQLTFGFKRRDGHKVGRPRKANSGVSHLKRQDLDPRHPVHVVLRLQGGLPSLRTKKPYQALRRAFAAGCDRFGFRLVHYSVQGNHLHLVVEAENSAALSRGMMGLAIRIAKSLNRLWRRKGKVFADRYFARILRTPLEVRNALQYVLKNGNHHGVHDEPRPDIFSSGMFFDGWRELRLEDFEVDEPPPLALAQTWLLCVGWRRHGLLSFAA